jgi:DNA-binding MarR family transcriptional regulator
VLFEAVGRNGRSYGDSFIDCATAIICATVAIEQVTVDTLLMPTEDHDAAPASVTEEQIDAIMLAAQALVGVAAQSVAEVEDLVTLPQLRVLVLVASRGTLNLNALALTMGVHPSNATRACDRLVVAGLLHRSESSVDRRNLVLSLTGNGQQVVDAMVQRRRRAVAGVLEQVPATRRRGLAAAMRAFGVAAGEAPAGNAWKLGWPR